MTAVVNALAVRCPDCAAEAGASCVWVARKPPGGPRSLPHHTRVTRATRAAKATP